MKSFDEIRAGESLPEYSITLDKERYYAYNALVGEINPLHFNEDYARQLGYKAPVVAGVFTFAFIPRLMETWLGKPGVCRRIEVRFIKPIYLDDRVRFAGKVKNKYTKDGQNLAECEVSVENEDGQVMIEADVTMRFRT